MTQCSIFEWRRPSAKNHSGERMKVRCKVRCGVNGSNKVPTGCGGGLMATNNTKSWLGALHPIRVLLPRKLDG